MSENNSNQIDIKNIIKMEYIKCSQDPVHFMKKYCYISHPQRGKILFHLYPFQEKVLKLFQNHDYSIINKSRQLGISTLVAGYALWLMIFQKDKNILVIATKQETAKNMVTKVKFMYDSLPLWLKGSKEPLEKNKLSLKLANNSQIKATSAASDAGRSESVSLLIIDEAAFIEGINTIYTSIKPTIATGGGCIALSSPKGIGNWFHTTWVDAEAGTNSFLPIKLPWNVHPERDKAWFDKECADMTPREIAQEYECDFLSSGNSVIEAPLLSFYEQSHIQDPIEKRSMGGDLWIWEYPDYTKQYIVCADVARGDASDYSTFHIIEVTECIQVAEFKSKIPTRDFGNLLTNISTEYNNALLVVENANLGWDVINTIIERGYNNLYYSPRSYGDLTPDKYLSKMDSDQTVPGFTNSLKTRPLVISKLQSYLNEKSFIFRSKRLLEELRTFIWHNGKAQATNGYNDDLCMALGFGLYIRDTALRYKEYGNEMTINILNNITKTQQNPMIYSNKNNFQNPYEINNGRYNEDIRWLLD